MVRRFLLILDNFLYYSFLLINQTFTNLHKMLLQEIYKI